VSSSSVAAVARRHPGVSAVFGPRATPSFPLSVTPTFPLSVTPAFPLSVTPAFPLSDRCPHAIRRLRHTGISAVSALLTNMFGESLGGRWMLSRSHDSFDSLNGLWYWLAVQQHGFRLAIHGSGLHFINTSSSSVAR